MWLGLPVVRKGWARSGINPWEWGSDVNHNGFPTGLGKDRKSRYCYILSNRGENGKEQQIRKSTGSQSTPQMLH